MVIPLNPEIYVYIFSGFFYQFTSLIHHKMIHEIRQFLWVNTPHLISTHMQVTRVNRKSMVIRPSGRSTDFISPSFGHGCLYDCSYCYMKRNKPKGLSIATNTTEILTAINNHVEFADVEKPNQTHEQYVTYDISCNEDFALHLKYHDWEKIFDFFRRHPKAMGSFATKYVNKNLLKYYPARKIRIRLSLMPHVLSSVLEPKTSLISDRIKSINDFIDAGYDVHINFSPVVITARWLLYYRELFQEINDVVYDDNKDKVKAEVIFLTHNIDKHMYNMTHHHHHKNESLLWRPIEQEPKISQYGGRNIRYKSDLKSKFIYEFIRVHDDVIPWNTIRYIF